MRTGNRRNWEAWTTGRYATLLTLPVWMIVIASCSNPQAGIAVAASTVMAVKTVTETAAAAGSATPSVTDPDTIAATVDCGDDGVADVSVNFGVVADDFLIGRNPTTLGAGGQSSFSQNYGAGSGKGDATLILSTTPTTGTCTTTLTDFDSGTVLTQRESAGKVTLTALVRGS